MRRFLVSVGPVVAVALLFACGGGDKPAEHPQGGTSGGAGGAGGSSEASDAGPSTTTSSLLVGDAGELQGSKLTSSGTITIDAGGTGSGKLDPHERDPGRSQQDLITIIQSHRDEARACYDTALKSHPGIVGNVDITWTIDPKGKVSDTGVDDSKSDIHEPGLVKCIGDVIRKIPWAASPRGVETRAHYPFNFHPHGAQH